MEAALAGDDALAKALGHDVVAGWATFTEALQPTRDALAANPSGSAWGARLFVARDPPELVGWGGFKGLPKDGVVEVGFEIAEARRGRGLATAATRAMLAEAFADERVTAVIAHTLPERNAFEPRPREGRLPVRRRGSGGRRGRLALLAHPSGERLQLQGTAQVRSEFRLPIAGGARARVHRVAGWHATPGIRGQADLERPFRAPGSAVDRGRSMVVGSVTACGRDRRWGDLRPVGSALRW